MEGLGIKHMRLFAFNTVRAPYRVDLYNELAKAVELTACFEQEHDPTRSPDWYSNDFRNFQMIHPKAWGKPLNCIKLDVLKAVRKKNVDLVYMSEWCTPTSLLLIGKCVMAKIPYALSMDGHIEKPCSPIKRAVKHFVGKHARLVIGTGKSTTDYAVSIGVDRRRVFEVGFTSLHRADVFSSAADSGEMARLKGEIGLDPQKKYILSVGQMVPRKGFDILLAAWSAAAPSEEWELLLVGDGAQKATFQQMAERLDLHNVHFLAGMPKDILLKHYRCADVFVLNTREDVWGLVINEAMACGLPVMTTRQCVAGVELIEDGINGYLYDCEDALQCRDYLSLLMRDESLRERMGMSNIRKMAGYTIEAESEKILQIIFAELPSQ